jgi:hypothetical protein
VQSRQAAAAGGRRSDIGVLCADECGAWVDDCGEAAGTSTRDRTAPESTETVERDLVFDLASAAGGTTRGGQSRVISFVGSRCVDSPETRDRTARERTQTLETYSVFDLASVAGGTSEGHGRIISPVGGGCVGSTVGDGCVGSTRDRTPPESTDTVERDSVLDLASAASETTRGGHGRVISLLGDECGEWADERGEAAGTSTRDLTAPESAGERDKRRLEFFDNLHANRLVRWFATSDRGKCQPPAVELGGGAMVTSSPSRRRSLPAWASRRRSRKHTVRAALPARLIGAAAVLPPGRGAASFNRADRPGADTRAGVHSLGRNPPNLSGKRPRGSAAAVSELSVPASRGTYPTRRRQSFVTRGRGVELRAGGQHVTHVSQTRTVEVTDGRGHSTNGRRHFHGHSSKANGGLGRPAIAGSENLVTGVADIVDVNDARVGGGGFIATNVSPSHPRVGGGFIATNVSPSHPRVGGAGGFVAIDVSPSHPRVGGGRAGQTRLPTPAPWTPPACSERGAARLPLAGRPAATVSYNRAKACGNSRVDARGDDWVNVRGNNWLKVRRDKRVKACGHTWVSVRGHNRVNVGRDNWAKACGNNRVNVCGNNWVKAGGYKRVKACVWVLGGLVGRRGWSDGCGGGGRCERRRRDRGCGRGGGLALSGRGGRSRYDAARRVEVGVRVKAAEAESYERSRESAGEVRTASPGWYECSRERAGEAGIASAGEVRNASEGSGESAGEAGTASAERYKCSRESAGEVGTASRTETDAQAEMPAKRACIGRVFGGGDAPALLGMGDATDDRRASLASRAAGRAAGGVRGGVCVGSGRNGHVRGVHGAGAARLSLIPGPLELSPYLPKQHVTHVSPTRTGRSRDLGEAPGLAAKANCGLGRRATVESNVLAGSVDIYDARIGGGFGGGFVRGSGLTELELSPYLPKQHGTHVSPTRTGRSRDLGEAPGLATKANCGLGRRATAESKVLVAGSVDIYDARIGGGFTRNLAGSIDIYDARIGGGFVGGSGVTELELSPCLPKQHVTHVSPTRTGRSRDLGEAPGLATKASCGLGRRATAESRTNCTPPKLKAKSTRTAKK